MNGVLQQPALVRMIQKRRVDGQWRGSRLASKGPLKVHSSLTSDVTPKRIAVFEWP
jgi:hypothetical protein